MSVNMKNAGLILIILVCMLFISGCQGGGLTNRNVNEDYRTGTEGVIIDFVDNAPPSKIYAGDPMEVVVELNNKGAYPDTDSFVGKLEIYGFENAAINGEWDRGNTISPSLKGRSQYNREGGYATMTYRDRDGVRVPFNQDSYKTEIVVASCYKYKTIANPSVCIDPDPYKLVQEKKACEVKDQSLGSQGAPVAVDRIEQEIGADKIYFRIFVKNKGSGSVVIPDRYNSCPFDIGHEDINKVIVRAKLSHDASPSCTPQGTASEPLRLVNGEGMMFCTFSMPGSDSAYQSPLNIELDYVYSDSISKSIEIVNLK